MLKKSKWIVWYSKFNSLHLLKLASEKKKLNWNPACERGFLLNRDQTRSLKEEVFLISGRSFSPFFIPSYIIYKVDTCIYCSFSSKQGEVLSVRRLFLPSLPVAWSLLKGKNLLRGNKSFLWQLPTSEKGGKSENGRVASPESNPASETWTWQLLAPFIYCGARYYQCSRYEGDKRDNLGITFHVASLKLWLWPLIRAVLPGWF